MSIKPTEVPRELSATGETRGELFNPYHAPEFRREVRACRWLSAGAKITYEALVDRNGRDGRCFPSSKTIAADIGMSERTVKLYLAELRASGLIKTTRQRTNVFEFERADLRSCPPSGADEGQTSARSGLGKRLPIAHHEGQTSALDLGKRLPINVVSNGAIERSQEKTDEIEPVGGIEKGEPRPSHSASEIKTMRHSLEAYMKRPALGPEATWATRPLGDDLVSKCLDAGRGASAEEISRHLGELYRREQAPFNDSGPKGWGWFPVVIAARFGKSTALDAPQQAITCESSRQRSPSANRVAHAEGNPPRDCTMSLRTRNSRNVPERFPRPRLPAPRKMTDADLLAALGG